jgi:hypothetical protein
MEWVVLALVLLSLAASGWLATRWLNVRLGRLVAQHFSRGADRDDDEAFDRWYHAYAEDLAKEDAARRLEALGIVVLAGVWLGLRLERPTVQRASAVLDFCSLLLPSRVADEQLGDLLETVHEMVADGQASWRIYLRTASGIAWTFYNAARGFAQPARGKEGNR